MSVLAIVPCDYISDGSIIGQHFHSEYFNRSFVLGHVFFHNVQKRVDCQLNVAQFFYFLFYRTLSLGKGKGQQISSCTIIILVQKITYSSLFISVNLRHHV